jgi:acyl-CoA synthetase (NDP forming)
VTGAVDALLRPRSVAVVGASEDPHKIGGRPLHLMRRQGYPGRLYPVSRSRTSVQGLSAWRDIAALPEAPDVAIIAVPGAQVEEAVAACARRGVSHALLFASGFGEVGAEGKAREARLTALARAGGTRLVGPNSIGIANVAHGTILSFASIFVETPPRDGPVAIVSQSGAFGVAAYALLREAGIGVRYLCATGNQADLTVTDFVKAVAGDEAVRLLLLYLEEVPDPARLEAALEIARARRLPVLAVKAGRTPEGERSARLHTGAEPADDRRVAELFERAAVRRVAGLDELCGAASLYLNHAPASGRAGIALISNSGASCVLGADGAADLGLPLARLADETLRAVRALLPDFSRNANPIDLTAMLLADGAMLGRCLDAALADPAVGAAMLGLMAVAGPSYDLPRFAHDARQAAARHRKPLVFCSPHGAAREAFRAEGIAAFRGEAEALGALHGWREHMTRLEG